MYVVPRPLTALCDGISRGEVTVLPVHVVDAGTRRVAQPDAEVLNLLRPPLVHLRTGGTGST